MKVRPLVLIGNGPSISGFDWERLDGVDTMAMNAFNRVSEETGWFPTYYCIFRRLDGIWGDEQADFVSRKISSIRGGVYYINTLWGGDRVFGGVFDAIPRCTPVDKKCMAEPPSPNYGGVAWSPPVDEVVEGAYARLVKSVGKDEADRLLEGFEMPDEELTVYGMEKWMRFGESAVLTRRDRRRAMRWNQSFMRPSSFSEFYSGPGDSSTDCARVASLLGYNLIILVGFDGRISVGSDGVVDPASWGIPNVFNGKELNLNEMVDCPVCRTTDGLDEKRMELWDCFLFSEALAKNPMVVWNCTDGSALVNLEHHDLDEAIALARSLP